MKIKTIKVGSIVKISIMNVKTNQKRYVTGAVTNIQPIFDTFVGFIGNQAFGTANIEKIVKL